MTDETGAKLLKDGKPLASALIKINHSVRHQPMQFGAGAAASLFIANPFSGKAFVNLFSTHPPFEERVRRLRSMNF